MDFDSLRKFIFEASRSTYASGDETVKQKQDDGSTTIEYKRGVYKYHDNYFGGEPYGGREVVFLENKPVWMMVYYGLVFDHKEKGDVYNFLMKALSNSTLDMPYRGPAFYENSVWSYENNMFGDIDRFSGTEKIFKGGHCVYEASYIGGLVDT